VSSADSHDVNGNRPGNRESASLRQQRRRLTPACSRSSAATAAAIPFWTIPSSRPDFSGSAGLTRCARASRR